MVSTRDMVVKACDVLLLTHNSSKATEECSMGLADVVRKVKSAAGMYIGILPLWKPTVLNEQNGPWVHTGRRCWMPWSHCSNAQSKSNAQYSDFSCYSYILGRRFKVWGTSLYPRHWVDGDVTDIARCVQDVRFAETVVCKKGSELDLSSHQG